MTDLEAIRQYKAAERYRDGILAERVPWIFDRDPEALAQYREIVQRSLDQAEAEMRKAERAVEQLPRPEWRDVMAWRFLQGQNIYDTAEAMAYSVRSIMRYEQQAVEYMETGKQPGRPGRPAGGP